MVSMFSMFEMRLSSSPAKCYDQAGASAPLHYLNDQSRHTSLAAKLIQASFVIVLSVRASALSSGLMSSGVCDDAKLQFFSQAQLAKRLHHCQGPPKQVKALQWCRGVA